MAIVLLALSGTSLLLLLGQTAHTMRSVRDAERAERQASQELERLAALDRAELLGRAGTSMRRGFVLEVSERSGGLFDVSISASDTTSAILRTVLYRPDTAHAAP